MNIEERILVFAPVGRDGPLAQKSLESAGLAVHLCGSMAELCAELAKGAGAALLTEEALDPGGIAALTAALQDQPAWSDFPVVLFAGNRLPELGRLANFTVLERPARMRGLLSAMRSALRARRRQYQARAMMEELKKSVRDRDQFLAMLGHELRNPLAAILTASEMMERGGSTQFSRERQIIARQVRHLGRMVDDLLDVARVTSGKIVVRRRPVELGALLRRVQPEWEARARDLGLTFAVEGAATPAWVLGDSLRLEQVLTNLVVNAFKYTPAGGRITIALGSENGEARLRVSDTGIGIDGKVLPHVFELFAQAEGALDRAQGGMGIGLTVVKRLVELHGGTVSAASAGPGQGSTFELRLPLCPPPEDAAIRKSQGAAPARRRVMVVEDNPDTREVLTLALEQAGHEVTSSPDGSHALDQVRVNAPEVMLIDIGLPGRDGYHLAREVRRALGSEPLLIALTGYGQAEDRRRALEAGFDEHLTKPVDLGTLEHAITVGRVE